MQVVTEFNKLLPHATLNIVINGSFDLSRRIADGSVDLAFVTEGNCPTRGPVVFRDRLVIIGPEKGDLYKIAFKVHLDGTKSRTTGDTVARRANSRKWGPDLRLGQDIRIGDPVLDVLHPYIELAHALLELGCRDRPQSR